MQRKKVLTSLFTLMFIAPLFAFLYSCNNTGQVPDVANINVSLQTFRFDKDLYAIDTDHIGEGLQKLHEKYPDFLDYYLDTIHEYGIHGNYSDTTKGIREGVKIDLTFKDFVNLEDTIMKYYPDSKETDAALTKGFRFMKYYFPSYQVPRIMYLDMGLSKWPSFPRDNATLCVGLDMFLGDGFPYRAYIGLPDYEIGHRRKNYIPVSVFSTVYRTKHPFEPDDRTLLDLMLQRGKEQYFLHKILPGTPDSVLFGFTQIQLDWCSKNEGLIYNFFIHQNLLYNKEGLKNMPYVNDGPFAKDLEAPSDPVKYSPGNIGTWMGYRIVCAWMEQNSKTTLAALLSQNTDPARFLDEAKYRPK